MVWLDSLCPLQKALGNYIFAYDFFFFFYKESNVKFIQLRTLELVCFFQITEVSNSLKQRTKVPKRLKLENQGLKSPSMKPLFGVGEEEGVEGGGGNICFAPYETFSFSFNFPKSNIPPPSSQKIYIYPSSMRNYQYFALKAMYTRPSVKTSDQQYKSISSSFTIYNLEILATKKKKKLITYDHYYLGTFFF